MVCSQKAAMFKSSLNFVEGINNCIYTEINLIVVFVKNTGCIKFCSHHKWYFDLAMLTAIFCTRTGNWTCDKFNIYIKLIKICFEFGFSDPFARVRAESVRTLTRCLAMVTTVPCSDVNIFPEYILPNLSPIAQDEVVSVRIAYAENIALLAETALRFNKYFS